MKKLGPILRGKNPKTYFFLISAINAYKRFIRPYSIYITDSLGGSFKNYFIESDMKEKVSDLKRNLDKESVDTIDVLLQRLLHYPDERFKQKTKKHNPVIGGVLPGETEEVKIKINKKLKGVKQELRFLSKHIEESVFYYHHGLSFLPRQVADYIKDEDFIDAGAFVGDSAIALKDYKYKKIYSIEISQKSIKRFRTNMAYQKISETKFEIINTSISSVDDKPSIRLADTGSSGLSLLRNKGKYDEISVDQKSIDYIVDKYKISPRFIKVDIEGNGLEFAKGATQTLTRFRPVLSIAIYHNPHEFFEIKPFLENLLPGYIFLIRKLSSGVKNNLCHSEVVLIGYPEEAVNNHNG